MWRSWSCQCLLSDSTKESPHRVRVELQAAKELCIKLNYGYSFLSLASDVFLFSLSAQPPTFRDSQAGLRLQAGKSWKTGTHSPSKLESDFVLPISLKLSHANLVKLQNWCFILSCVFRRFSKPVCQGEWLDVGAIFTPDFCASV